MCTPRVRRELLARFKLKLFEIKNQITSATLKKGLYIADARGGGGGGGGVWGGGGGVGAGGNTKNLGKKKWGGVAILN